MRPDEAPSVRLVCGRIRRLLALGHPRLAQALDDARALGVEGRIVGPVDARPFLHGEAGIDFLQLRCGLLRLLVVAGPGVGGGEIDKRVPNLRRARVRLVAPFDRLFPLRQMGVEGQTSNCHGDARIART